MEAVKRELEALCKLDKSGLLRPDAVVRAARNPKSALHEYFEWDDSIAAEKWRLEQARQLIRIVVDVIVPNEPPTRIYVSEAAARVTDGGGYVPFVSILSDEDRWRAYLQQALTEIDSLRRRYERIKELRPIWLTAQRVRERTNPPPGGGRRRRQRETAAAAR